MTLDLDRSHAGANPLWVGSVSRGPPSGTLSPMERTTLYEDDLTEERSSTPVEREEVQHTLALDPDIDPGDDDDDEDDEEDEDLDDG